MRAKIFIIFAVMLFGLTIVSSSVSAEGVCPGTQILCSGAGCIEPRSTVGASCGTGGRQYSDRCGSCGCPVGTTSCTDTSRCIPIVSCDVAGTTFSACPVGSSGSCETPYALRSPSVGQTGNYISVTGGTNPTVSAPRPDGTTTAPPVGALYFNTSANTLRVRTGVTGASTDWKDVSGATYGAGRNIDPGSIVAGSPSVAVVGTPSFDGVKVGTGAIAPAAGDAGLTGDMYLNSGKAVRVDAAGETRLNMGNYNGSASNFHLALNAGSGGLADVLFRQGGSSGSDRWAMALRPAGEGNNFQILRNNGVWTSSLQVDYADGGVTIPSTLTVGDGITVPSADSRFGGDVEAYTLTATTGASIFGELDIGGGGTNAPAERLPDYLRIVNIDNDTATGSPVPQYAIRVTDEDQKEWFSVRKDANSVVAGGPPTVSINTLGTVNAANINVSGTVTAPFMSMTGSGTVAWTNTGIDLGGRLTAGQFGRFGTPAYSIPALSSVPAILQAQGKYSGISASQYLLSLDAWNDAGTSRTSRFTVDRDGTISTNGGADFGTGTGDDITGGGHLILSQDADVSNASGTNASYQDSLQGGTVQIGNGARIMRIDGNEISSTDDLYFQFDQRYRSTVLGGALRVRYSDGSTSTREVIDNQGQFKFTGNFNTAAKGKMVLYGLPATSCTTICSSHGLTCSESPIQFTSFSTNTSETTCSSTTSNRLCFCE